MKNIVEILEVKFSTKLGSDMFLVVTFKWHLPLAGIDLKISHQVKNLNLCAAELLVNRLDCDIK